MEAERYRRMNADAAPYYRLGAYIAIGFIGVMAAMGVALLVPSVLLVEMLFG